MEKLADLRQFQDRQNIVLQGFDPVSAGGFTQVPNILLKDPKVSANAKVVYSMLLSYAWNNAYVFPGQERLGEDIGLSQPTIARAVKELEQQGWLEIQRRGEDRAKPTSMSSNTGLNPLTAKKCGKILANEADIHQ
ncbi:MAG: helix-turn-helix domain-containing protein [Acidobacteria bacterium]|nr:helix-turn-helix domain-containing protein [Acidobacteriota bacterium]